MRASVAFEPYPDQEIVPNWCFFWLGLDRSVFENSVFVHRPGSPAIWVASNQVHLIDTPLPETVGLLVMRKPPPKGKPTSVFLQRFADGATKNVYTLDAEDAERFLRRDPVQIVPVDDARSYCVVRTADFVLGCGRVNGNTLVSEVPRSWMSS